MKRLKANGNFGTSTGGVHFSLDVYLFNEDGLTYSYCPSLDITGYGKDMNEAKAEMEYQLKEYFDYTLKHDTLRSDLAGHGWTKDNDDHFFAPSVSYLMRKYPDFKDLIENKEYTKYTQPVGAAVYA